MSTLILLFEFIVNLLDTNYKASFFKPRARYKIWFSRVFRATGGFHSEVQLGVPSGSKSKPSSDGPIKAKRDGGDRFRFFTPATLGLEPSSASWLVLGIPRVAKHDGYPLSRFHENGDT